MEKELYEDLKKTYDSVKLVLAAKSLSIEMEKGEEYDCQYDLPLLTITYRDLGDEENSNLEYRLLQVRVRDDNDGRGEQLAIVMTTNGAFKCVNDIDEDLKSAAEIVEKATEEFLTMSPDVVYNYKWTDFTLDE